MDKSVLRVVAVAASLVLLVGACGDSDDDDPTQLPNPAAVFCEDQGGVVSGPEPMCELPDGSIVDAWEYYRASQDGPGAGLANPAAVFCEDQGGTTFGPEPMCELADGSVVDAWDHFRTATAGGATTGSTVAAEPVLSVEEALVAGNGPATVRGLLFGDRTGFRLCSALAESFPPQCPGPAVSLRDFGIGDFQSLPDDENIALQEEQGIFWADMVLELTGTLEAGELIIPLAATEG